jgi:hypothetical protein
MDCRRDCELRYRLSSLIVYAGLGVVLYSKQSGWYWKSYILPTIVGDIFSQPTGMMLRGDSSADHGQGEVY